MNAMIKRLPEEIQGKFRSGVAIPSLQQCVEELILNSIDAGATCVSVRIDMEAFKVQVIDNGAGMSAEDMESVGNRYHTSKCSSVEDLDHLRYYGFRGEAVASIISLATLVEISSRVKSSAKTYVKIFKDGKCLDVFEAEDARPSAGTTFIIYNFFHNMPVRRKRMDAVLEGERIRHRVEAISLMHPSVSFTLKNDCTGAMMVQLSKARNTYHRFVQIHGLGRAQKLGEVSYTGGQFEVTGYIGREGHYNNSLQFLYVNDRLLLKTRIHKLLNFLLRRLRSSNQKNDSPEGHSAIRSPKHKRSQELHGVYIINIKCSYSEYDVCLEPAKTLIEFKDWTGVLLCIEEAVKVFLNRENLVAELSQDDLEYASPKLFGITGTDQEGNSSSQGIQVTSTLDCTIGMKLASESVHRKHKDDSVLESSVGQESVQMENKGDQEEQQGQKRIITNDLENTESCTKKECGDESQCDSFTLKAEFESVSDNTLTEEEEPTSSNSGEDSQIVVYMPDSDRQLRKKQLELSKEGEKRINTITSTSTVTLQDSIAQEIQPDLNMTESFLHGHTVINRKINLSDPYIHESLQTDLSQSHKPTFQQQNLVPKSEQTSCTSKRKISLIESTHHNRSSHKVCKDIAPVIPAKISRVVSCESLILCKQSGSLDKFRRIYGKSAELISSSLETHSTHSLNDDRLPQTGGFVSNPKNIVVSQKDQQKDNITETQRSENAFRSPPTLSVFTKLKPISAQNKAKEKSLAAKLCHLKQHRTEVTKGVLEHLPRATSQDDACLKIPDNDIQDDKNNNEHPCGTALNAEQIPGCSTNLQVDEKEEDTASGDWLHHYDTSLGKIVYVNKVTGLSRYENPTTQLQVRCTSDVTNMAVSVISDSDDAIKNSNSLTSMYSKWNNPVFVRPPMVGVDISSGQADGLAVKIHNILFPYRFSKAMIHSMKVIHQVDKKFLACLINTREEESTVQLETEGNLLVLVDQHAADERVRLENLVADSYEDDPHAPGERRLCSSTILPPLEISATEEELRLLRSCQPHLRSLGLEVQFSQTGDPRVLVGKVPLCFMEKERNEVKRGRSSVIKPIVEEYLQEQIELFRSTGRVRGTLPLTVLKVLASLACHGAVKFNDSLSRDECSSLVESLSSCQLPFQCAHGRPSIAPLVDILHLDTDQKELLKPNLQKLRRMYKAWELFGNR